MDRDAVTDRHVVDALAELDERAGDLVPERDRNVRRCQQPVEEVQLGPAHARSGDLHEHLPPTGLRPGHLLDAERPTLA